MNSLDVERINRIAPYKVDLKNGEYVFESDFDILYSIWFEEQPILDEGIIAYWLNLTNRSQKASPNDQKIRTTVVLILEEFFRSNPDVLLYMCDSADEQQAMRSRLFLRWFSAYGKQADFYSRSEMVKDGMEDNYISIIVKRSHPKLQVIKELFDDEIQMFRASKP